MSARKIVLIIFFYLSFCIILMVTAPSADAVLEEGTKSQGTTFFSSKRNLKSDNYVPGRVIVKLTVKGMNVQGNSGGLKSATVPLVLTQNMVLKNILNKYGMQQAKPAFGSSITAIGQSSSRIHSKGLSAQSGDWYTQFKKKFPNRSYPDIPREVQLERIFVVHLDPKADIFKVLEELNAQKDLVEYAEPDYLMHTMELNNDFYADGQGDGKWHSGAWGQSYQDLWGLKAFNADKVWVQSQGEGVVVAVVDTGVDLNHPDLKANIWQKATLNLIIFRKVRIFFPLHLV